MLGLLTEYSPRSPDPNETITSYVKELGLTSDNDRYFGASSGFELVKSALDYKQNVYCANGECTLQNPLSVSNRPEFWHIRRVSSFLYSTIILSSYNQWERSTLDTSEHKYVFPEEDLIFTLLDIYFTEIDPYIPLIHRPTFEASVRAGLHLRDRFLGATLLVVCACSARYSNDPRVLCEGEKSWLSAGWKWFNQVQTIRNYVIHLPSLHELQFYCVRLYSMMVIPHFTFFIRWLLFFCSHHLHHNHAG